MSPRRTTDAHRPTRKYNDGEGEKSYASRENEKRSDTDRRRRIPSPTNGKRSNGKNGAHEKAAYTGDTSRPVKGNGQSTPHKGRFPSKQLLKHRGGNSSSR